jgi:dTDP-4-dehydrorhamnose reductase
MEKILILGGNSKLAKCFIILYPNITKALTKNECDITSAKNVEKVIKNTSAKYILNCAAITDIEYCEKNKTECLEVNTFAVNRIELACKINNKKLIHISSDFALYPKSVYGLSKKLNEKMLDKKRSLIIRTSFYSLDYFLIRKLLQKSKIEAYDNVYFNPVSINRVAKETYKNRDRFGVLNIFSDKQVSKYKFALKVSNVFNIETNLINRVMFTNKRGYAKRPFNTFIKSDIHITLQKDLMRFKDYLLNKNLII